MSEDEVMVVIAAVVFAFFRWVMWYYRVVAVGSRFSRHSVRAPLYLAPLVTGAITWIVLRWFASYDVRNDGVYLFFYMALGAAWTGAVTIATSMLGISYRDDVAERGNVAASWAAAGAVVGGSLPYIGSNIGDGPGWWVVIYTGGAAAVLFFALWLLVEKTTSLSDSITIDRDVSAGLRLGGLLVGMGLVLARAAAGNWYGPEQAVTQVLQVGLAAVAMAVVAIAVERMLRPTPEHPRQPAIAGIVPAGFYVGMGAAWLAIAGWWT